MDALKPLAGAVGYCCFLTPLPTVEEDDPTDPIDEPEDDEECNVCPLLLEVAKDSRETGVSVERKPPSVFNILNYLKTEISKNKK